MSTLTAADRNLINITYTSDVTTEQLLTWADSMERTVEQTLGLELTDSVFYDSELGGLMVQFMDDAGVEFFAVLNLDIGGKSAVYNEGSGEELALVMWDVEDNDIVGADSFPTYQIQGTRTVSEVLTDLIEDHCEVSKG